MAKRIIKVVEYNEAWQVLFLKEKQSLSKLLNEHAIAIEHIGSTSVVGLRSKPIIDILVEVNSLSVVDTLIADFEKLGYKARGENGIEGRRYFQKGGVNRTHHLHIFELGSLHALNHRIFRDYLKSHPKLAIQYGEIKKCAANKCNNDMQVYMALKDEFIKTQLKNARSWYENNTNL